MLLQTNSYVVPGDKRAAHARLLKEFRQAMARLGCDLFDVYEQAGPNWDQSKPEGRFVQILRFRDRAHQLAVQAAEREDAEAQRRISEFCELINFPYQQEHGLFAVGFYTEMAPDAENEPIPPAAPGAAADSDAYVEQDLDAIVASFGDPRELLNEASPGRPAVPRPRTSDPKAFPRLVPREDAAPPSEEELDSLLQEQFAPAAPKPARDSHAGDPELGRVLDEGMADDELDIAMPAELLDEDEMEGLDLHDTTAAAASATSRVEPARPNGRPAGR